VHDDKSDSLLKLPGLHVMIQVRTPFAQVRTPFIQSIMLLNSCGLQMVFHVAPPHYNQSTPPCDVFDHWDGHR
jgi:hypothetical protein